MKINQTKHPNAIHLSYSIGDMHSFAIALFFYMPLIL